MAGRASSSSPAYAFFFSFLLLPSSFFISSSSSLRFSLTHRDSPASPFRRHDADPSDLPDSMPMREFVAFGRALRSRVAEQSKSKSRARAEEGHTALGRFSYLSENVGDFYLSLPVGEPPQELVFTLDTGSELTWAQCVPCRVCSDTGGPSYDYNASLSYGRVPCSSPLCTQSLGFAGGCSNATRACVFQLQYGDGSVDAGYVSVDDFHFEGAAARRLVFGCAVVTVDTVPIPISGVMGLSAGPFSFVSQLLGPGPGALGPAKFAYCLPDRYLQLKSQGLIEFGHYELPRAPPLARTPLAPPSPPLGSLYYYVSLESISVGSSTLSVAAILARSSSSSSSSNGTAAGGGGTIFDSGTAVSHLVGPLYDALASRVRRRTRALRPFALKAAGSDLCYRIPSTATELPELPLVTFRFAPSARAAPAAAPPPPQLSMEPQALLYPAAVDGHDIILCFAFTRSSSAIALNVIGNYQQQNHWIEYNLESATIGIAKATCPTL